MWYILIADIPLSFAQILNLLVQFSSQINNYFDKDIVNIVKSKSKRIYLQLFNEEMVLSFIFRENYTELNQFYRPTWARLLSYLNSCECFEQIAVSRL